MQCLSASINCYKPEQAHAIARGGSSSCTFAAIDLSAADFTFGYERVYACLAEAMANAIHAKPESLSFDPVLTAKGFVVVGAGALELFAVTRGLPLSTRGYDDESRDAEDGRAD
jgi:hypothetical protein